VIQPSTAHRRKLEADNARLRQLLQQALRRADALSDEEEPASSEDIEDWFAAWRPKVVAALDRQPQTASSNDSPPDDPMHEPAPALFTALSEVREELEVMSGSWTERMANLAQQADQALASADG